MKFGLYMGSTYTLVSIDNSWMSGDIKLMPNSTVMFETRSTIRYDILYLKNTVKSTV